MPTKQVPKATRTTKERTARVKQTVVAPPFHKFSPKQFENWRKLPRAEMIQQIIERHGVKHFLQKAPKKEKINWLVPIRVEAHGTPGYKGSYRFWLKIPGKRPYALHLPVDVPIAALKKVVPVPNWRESKNYRQISATIGEFTSNFMRQLLRSRSDEAPVIELWFAEMLSRGGFMGSEFAHQLEIEITPDLFLSMCQKYFLHSEKAARAFLKGFTLDDIKSLSEEQWQIIETS